MRLFSNRKVRKVFFDLARKDAKKKNSSKSIMVASPDLPRGKAGGSGILFPASLDGKRLPHEVNVLKSVRSIRFARV
jgi:hypothetical protein